LASLERVCALGNISGDSVEMVDYYVLMAGAMLGYHWSNSRTVRENFCR
jgi:hypothetical protein